MGGGDGLIDVGPAYTYIARTMAKKLTITVSDEVYEGLYEKVGARRIGKYLETLVREDLRPRTLAEEYADAAKDEEAEAEAREWIESGIGECLPDEDFSDWPGYPSR
jgi:predicted CopG family antitoxin